MRQSEISRMKLVNHYDSRMFAPGTYFVGDEATYNELLLVYIFSNKEDLFEDADDYMLSRHSNFPAIIRLDCNLQMDEFLKNILHFGISITKENNHKAFCFPFRRLISTERYTFQVFTF